ncbi:hypothetical protein DV737_g2866, partial [Chaetothyriales sp. CBS 132003]
MARDSARDRELHRYYQPWLEAFHTPKPTDHVSRRKDGFVPQNSQDRALTAFAQLGALRLAVKRCIVTLIDSKNQYVLAEATRSLSLMDDLRHADGDELWMGNAVFPRSQGISHQALVPPVHRATGPGEDEFSAAALVVQDVANDERYKDRAYAGAGGVHFYAGVPMTTRLGHTIGVYSVTHDHPRPSLNAEELRTMVDMAAIAMNHLEVTRNERARARGERLIGGIANFIAGAEDGTMDTPQTSFEIGPNQLEDVPTRQKQPSVPPRNQETVFEFKGMTISDMNAAAREQFFSDSNQSASLPRNTSNRSIEVRLQLNRAPSTDVPNSDSQPSLTSGAPPKPVPSPKSRYLAVFDRAARILRRCMGADGVAFVDASAANLMAHSKYLKISFAASFDDIRVVKFTLLMAEVIQYSASSTESSRRPFRKKNPLFSTFPDARTIVFLPLWDFAMGRWNSSAVVWSNSASRLVNIQDDLSYLMAFSNTIMSEIARLNLAVSDTAKGTFLANISHELRSPLHGILGSIEFLHDSPLDDFQSSMVISVETCGKTLLDTVDHVLDFAKLHNLSKRTYKNGGITQATTSDSSLTRHFDLAMVVEEAVEAVYAGQVLRTHPADAADGHGLSLPSSQVPAIKQQSATEPDAKAKLRRRDAVRLTLNIDDAINWHVTSQPGAVRRVVMNLLGNSLKYTESGSIDVSLEIDHSRDQDHDGYLHNCLTVTDTGKGMSDDFVKNQAFTAFSQEDSLASGTGLGLSIIRKIVDSLCGKIDLRSQKGLGTEIKVWLSLPIHQEDVPAVMSTPKSILQEMQARTGGMLLCLLTPRRIQDDLPSPKSTLRRMPTVEDSVRNLAAQWFSMKVFEQSPMAGVDADLFIYTEPPPIEYLLQHHGKHDDRDMTPIIILCQNAFQAGSLRANGLHDLVEQGRIIEIIVQPVGPQKLARVLHRCMQRMKKLEDPIKLHSKSVMLTTRKSDDIVVLAPRQRPKLGRAAASLDSIATTSSSGRWTSPLRHNSATIPNKTKDAERTWQGRGETTLAEQSEDTDSLPRVLVVDDNHINLQLLETMVRKTKYPYESATDGQKAVDLYQKAVNSGTRFRYILMDISMPVMNGWQATREIRRWENENQIFPPVKIFALTGMGDETTAKNEAKQAGFDKILSKPVKFKDLSSLLV